MPKNYNILISGGGTGGHIFPAVAIANALKARLKENVNILFVGAEGRMEMEKVPQAGYPIEGLWISGLQRKLDLQNLSFPFKLANSLFRANKIIKKFKPDVAIGTGGYASGPLLYQAARKKVPTLILEQNSYPGITNRYLGKSVNTICVGYEGMEGYFPKEKIIVTGSPIRKEILDMKVTKEEALKFFKLKTGLPVILVIGGSQGALKPNQIIAENLDLIVSENVQLLWQTGKHSIKMAKLAADKAKLSDNIKVTEFINRMDMAYAAADLVISRAGAIAIAEIVAVKKPAIFIPLPSAAEDHQTKNATALVKGKAAVMVKEKEAHEKLAPAITEMIKNQSKRLVMVQNLKRFDHPEATGQIVDEALKIINK